MTSAFSWQNSISLCPASFCIPRPNLPLTPGIILYSKAKLACYSGCLLTSYFCILDSYDEKDTLFLVLVLKGLVGLHRTCQL